MDGDMSLGPWTRGDVLDLHIFILLLIWFTLDRLNIYFNELLPKLWRAAKQVCTLDFWRGK